MPVHLQLDQHLRPDSEPVEVVERKGVGHPDTVCDHLAEELSLALTRFYVEHFGRPFHHNVDKALLWAGRARSAYGGGEVLEPMEVFLAGRGTLEVRGVEVPVEELAISSANAWLRRHFHALDPERHVRIRSLVRSGSSELVDLFDRHGCNDVWLANDTSIGVGFAPLSQLESIVLGVESHLNSASTKRTYPEAGEDIKVLGVRKGSSIYLTIACAFVDRHVADLTEYVEKKRRLARIAKGVASRYTGRELSVVVNAADDPGRDAVYTTVTGTSAEAGDDGQAGRGNRGNGLITPSRRMTLESIAGKNPVTHVGKLYNLSAGLIADRLVGELTEITAADCTLVSRIGLPVSKPSITAVRVEGPEEGRLQELRCEIEGVVDEELGRLDRLWEALLDRSLAFDRWPLRRRSASTPSVDSGHSPERDLMVREIEKQVRWLSGQLGKDSLAPEVLTALRAVPRHEFVPPKENHLAYGDFPLSIGYGQTISQPFMVALMTDLLRPRPEHVVLEIGTGSGYQAAVLGELVKDVFSIEIVEALVGPARARLERLGYRNVHVRAGDGALGWRENAPYDSIVVTAAAAEVPAPLLEQLAPGGRLVIPVGRGLRGQTLVLFEKSASGEVTRRDVLAVAFVPLSGSRGFKP